MIYGLVDYARFMCDPDLGRREERCAHCGESKDECEPMQCARCGTRTCSESLVCVGCDEAESSGCRFCRGAMAQCWEVACVRCGTAGCSNTMAPEECDEWECPPCNARENVRQRVAP